MAHSIFELKSTIKERLEALRLMMRPNLGSHKRITLRKAGCERSGSLLHKQIAKIHATLLRDDFATWIPRVRKDLRFLTILHEVTPLSAGIAALSISDMEDEIKRVFSSTGIRCFGASEVEVVNLTLLRHVGAQSDNETRKLNVLEGLCSAAEDQPNIGVLIHFHGLVDLSNSILLEDQVRTRLQSRAKWQRAPFQVELKSLFQNRSIEDNLRDIAAYITKGGNDTLRYNLKFGRDNVEALDAQIWRAGMGRADQGAETLSDERSMSFAEIAFLDRLWLDMMNKRRDRRGYLLQFDGLRGQ